MGNFYTNLTLRTSDRQAVIRAMKGRKAFISPNEGGIIRVYDEECDTQDDKINVKLARDLARELQCPALAVLNHDDDVMIYWLTFPDGSADEYNSAPSYFEGGDDPPTGGDASLLAKAFPGSNAAAIEKILRDPEYVFVVERHQALTGALGLAQDDSILGYRYLSRGEIPGHWKAGEFTKLE